MKSTNFKFLFLVCGLVALSVTATYLATRATFADEVKADNEYQAGAVLWFQNAAENRALAYQAFNLARLRIDEQRKKCKKKKSPCAVVVDVDETVLDNSPGQAWLIKNRQNFDAKTNWLAWCLREEAKPLAGAVEFLQYAASQNIKVFYVTNRREAEKAATVNNLQKFKFPDVSEETLMVRTDKSTKEPRRDKIKEKYRIILLMGDNLNDFSNIFEEKNVADRFAVTDQNKAEFGSRFIVLPNPMYGDWEGAIYDYKFNRSEEEKSAIRGQFMKSF